MSSHSSSSSSSSPSSPPSPSFSSYSSNDYYDSSSYAPSSQSTTDSDPVEECISETWFYSNSRHNNVHTQSAPSVPPSSIETPARPLDVDDLEYDSSDDDDDIDGIIPSTLSVKASVKDVILGNKFQAFNSKINFIALQVSRLRRHTYQFLKAFILFHREIQVQNFSSSTSPSPSSGSSSPSPSSLPQSSSEVPPISPTLIFSMPMWSLPGGETRLTRQHIMDILRLLTQGNLRQFATEHRKEWRHLASHFYHSYYLNTMADEEKKIIAKNFENIYFGLFV